MRWERWAVLILAAALLLLVRRILPPFVVAAVIAYVVSPAVAMLRGRGVPRALAATLVFLAVLAPLIVTAALAGPGLVSQTRELISSGPDLIENVLLQVIGPQPLQLFGAEVAPRSVAVRIVASVRDALGHPADAFHAAEQVVESVVNLVLTLLAIFYFLLDGHRLGQFLLRFVPTDQQPHVLAVAPRIHRVLGRFLGGQALLVGLMSAVTFLVLHFVFHLRFALPIAIASGFLEVIPVVGPISAGAIACVVALGQDGVALAVWVALAYLILRQVEDQFVMPLVVGRVVHLHPLVTIFAVLAGGALAGILGMILAVPAAASIRVILDYCYPDPGEASSKKVTTPPPAYSARQ